MVSPVADLDGRQKGISGHSERLQRRAEEHQNDRYEEPLFQLHQQQQIVLVQLRPEHNLLCHDLFSRILFVSPFPICGILVRGKDSIRTFRRALAMLYSHGFHGLPPAVIVLSECAASAYNKRRRASYTAQMRAISEALLRKQDGSSCCSFKQVHDTISHGKKQALLRANPIDTAPCGALPVLIMKHHCRPVGEGDAHPSAP